MKITAQDKKLSKSHKFIKFHGQKRVALHAIILFFYTSGIEEKQIKYLHNYAGILCKNKLILFLQCLNKSYDTINF